MSTAREIVARAMSETWRSGSGFIVQPKGPPATDWGVFADAVLAALREHGYVVKVCACRYVTGNDA